MKFESRKSVQHSIYTNTVQSYDATTVEWRCWSHIVHKILYKYIYWNMVLIEINSFKECFCNVEGCSNGCNIWQRCQEDCFKDGSKAIWKKLKGALISRKVLVTRLFNYNLGEFLEKWCKDPGQLIKLLVVVPGKCQWLDICIIKGSGHSIFLNI